MTVINLHCYLGIGMTHCVINVFTRVLASISRVKHQQTMPDINSVGLKTVEEL